MRIPIRCFAVLIALFFCAAAVHAQLADRKESPFEALRWVDGEPQVFVASVWYHPVSIDGVDVGAILAFCEVRWPGLREKRFGEDLVEAVELMGHSLPTAVDLVLLRVDDGQRVEVDDVPMTRANRRAILNSVQVADISRLQAIEDIDAFKRVLDDQFAYRYWRPVDLDEELANVQASLGDRVSRHELATALNRVLALFGDGHARVRPPTPNDAGKRYTPFLLGDVGDGFVAFQSDRSDFIDPGYPYLIAIDGVGIEQWIAAAEIDITRGSPQLMRDRSMRMLRELDLIRDRLGLPRSESVRCRLASGTDGLETIEVNLELIGRKPIYGIWPQSESGILEGDIGYLRIERMTDEVVPAIRSSMDAFRGTDGLIIDVRGNGGGTRSALLAIAGYLVGPDEGPWVANVAKYRLSDRFESDHLEARSMYRSQSEYWSEAQKEAIEKFADGFSPDWVPGAGFSAWHYLVLDRTGDAGEYFYDRPVVVLSDSGCFSATDIFLGALAERPRITLLGSASAGGSARSQRYRLPNSGIEITCASMASFRPDGRMYDGRGIEVDIELNSEPVDFLINGGDAVLDAACAYIRAGH